MSVGLKNTFVRSVFCAPRGWKYTVVSRKSTLCVSILCLSFIDVWWLLSVSTKCVNVSIPCSHTPIMSSKNLKKNVGLSVHLVRASLSHWAMYMFAYEGAYR